MVDEVPLAMGLVAPFWEDVRRGLTGNLPRAGGYGYFLWRMTIFIAPVVLALEAYWAARLADDLENFITGATGDPFLLAALVLFVIMTAGVALIVLFVMWVGFQFLAVAAAILAIASPILLARSLGATLRGERRTRSLWLIAVTCAAGTPILLAVTPVAAPMSFLPLLVSIVVFITKPDAFHPPAEDGESPRPTAEERA